MGIRDFVRTHYRHFNAATLRAAADAYRAHLDGGGRMLLAMAGAMSTAEIGRSLAEMIRRERVHAICCTGANLEEDLFHLVARSHYRSLPDWRNLTPRREKELERQGLNRVTDTCIPEEQAMRAISEPLQELWRRADRAGESRFPHEYLFELIRGGTLAGIYDADPRDSWVVAAAETELPVFVPGWEDSTLGNCFVADVLEGRLSGFGAVRGGLEAMAELTRWYARATMDRDPGGLAPLRGPDAKAPAGARSVGFFQIGGGIAGDFPICVVPLIRQDLERLCPYWGYFCQISDSTTSYGSYSGAVPSEKISWGKLDVDTPMFVIESDASIVAPLVFAYVLEGATAP